MSAPDVPASGGRRRPDAATGETVSVRLARHAAAQYDGECIAYDALRHRLIGLLRAAVWNDPTDATPRALGGIASAALTAGDYYGWFVLRLDGRVDVRRRPC